MTYSLGTPQVAADLVEENRLFLNSVLFDAGGDKASRPCSPPATGSSTPAPRPCTA
jgi:hypothetical protein